MATNYHSMPPPGVTVTTNLDTAVPKAFSPSPFYATIKSVPELFTIFGQATVGIAKVSG